jgi:hypothetical protein
LAKQKLFATDAHGYPQIFVQAGRPRLSLAAGIGDRRWNSHEYPWKSVFICGETSCLVVYDREINSRDCPACLTVVWQCSVRVHHNDHLAGEYFPDLLVEDVPPVELQTVKALDDTDTFLGV